MAIFDVGGTGRSARQPLEHPSLPDLSTEAFPSDLHQRLLGRLGTEPLTVSVAESRSQFRNRMLARARLRDLLTDAMKEPKKRRPTKPSRSAKRKRLEDKRARGEKKRLRRNPRID